jgi:hypothetical protein
MLFIYNHHCKQKKMINLNKLEFFISLVPYGMLLIFNHHCKQKKTDLFEQIGISYMCALLWNVTYLQPSLQTKKMINSNKLEFPIFFGLLGNVIYL